MAFENLEGLLPLAFQAGAGQGTVDTPTNWNAVLDVILDALSKLVRTYYKDAFATSVVDMAAADDSPSTRGSLRCVILMAAVVSAFCIMFGPSRLPSCSRS